MKQHLRKLSALLLTLVLAISLAPAALAAPTAVANTEITFDGVMAGDTVTAYPMVTYDPTYSSFTYHAAFKTFLENKRAGAGTSAGTSLDAWFSGLASDVLSGYLTEYTEKVQAGTANLPTAKVEDTVATGATSTTLSLAPGFYLVLTSTTKTNSKVYTPVAVFLRVTDDGSGKVVKVYAGGSDTALSDPYTITLKSQSAPVITKLVRNTSSDLGHPPIPHQPTASSGVGTHYGVEFVIKVTIPNYDGDPGFHKLTIEDTLVNAKLTMDSLDAISIHREYDEGTGLVFGENLNDARMSTSSIDTYKVNPTTGIREQKIVLNLDYSKLKSPTSGVPTVFYIRYYARLQKDAIDTDTPLTSGTGTTNMAKNTATLTYALATDPTTEKTSDPSSVSTSIYTYSIKLEKKDMDGNALDGATFSLYRDAAMHDKVALTKDAAGFYYPADVPAADDPIVTGGSESSFLIKGLEQGTYYLKETATKAGYYLPKDVFEIVLTGEGNTTTGRRLTGKLDESNSKFTAMDPADDTLIDHTKTAVDTTAVNQLDIVLKNSSQPILPSTGGMGTALFTFGGVALMVLAAGLTIYMRKRKEN